MLILRSRNLNCINIQISKYLGRVEILLITWVHENQCSGGRMEMFLIFVDICLRIHLIFGTTHKRTIIYQFGYLFLILETYLGNNIQSTFPTSVVTLCRSN